MSHNVVDPVTLWCFENLDSKHSDVGLREELSIQAALHFYQMEQEQVKAVAAEQLSSSSCEQAGVSDWFTN
jgi:hypothetical protein